MKQLLALLVAINVVLSTNTGASYLLPKASTKPKSKTASIMQARNQIQRHFIFGYGSLVCAKSRKITAPTLTAAAHPVVVSHIRRTWTTRVASGWGERPDLDHVIHGQTAMGIERREGHDCTGVLIEVDTEELKHFDGREKGYDRVEIDLHHVYSIYDDDHTRNLQHDHDVLRNAYQRRNSSSEDSEWNDGNSYSVDADDDAEADGLFKVWVYIPKEGQALAANDRFPIMQSYVDIILRGCLSIGEDFALKFLESTHGWWHDEIEAENVPQYVWVDDRHAPYYVRADMEWSLEMRHVLDSYLQKVHPQPFERREHLDALKSL